MDKKHLIYQAYGRMDIIHNCLYSILSFFATNPQTDIEVFVYTDKAKLFHQLFGDKVTCIPLDASTIEKWKGEHGFVHRLKIEMIRDFCRTHQGQVIYMDADTRLKGCMDPLYEKIGQGFRIMHLCEGAMNFFTNPKVHRLLFCNEKKFRENSIALDPNMEMWNAGVIGFDTNEKNLPEEILAFVDRIYPIMEKHILTEQIAVSYYFINGERPIASASQIVYHYWFFGEFSRVLAQFFDRYGLTDYRQLIQKLNIIDPESLSYNKREYMSLNRRQKNLRLLTKGHKWKMPVFVLD